MTLSCREEHVHTEKLKVGGCDGGQEKLQGPVCPGASLLLWPIPGDSCSLSPTPEGDTLFELGFVKAAVNKLGCFPSDKLPSLIFRIAP